MPYGEHPVLLEALARPWSVTWSHPLAGWIDGVELELFVLGTTWAFGNGAGSMGSRYAGALAGRRT